MKIVNYKGPERVRKRPQVIFGSDGIEGVMTALEMVLTTLLEEHLNGSLTQMLITQHCDNSISIQDNGRGIFLGEDDKLWQNLFCQLYAGSAYALAQKQQSIFEAPCGDSTLFGDNLELCAVQYASEYMDVCVWRDSFEYRLHFEKGENKGGLAKTPSTQSSGTYIRFKPDPAVFSDIALPTQWLSSRARELALLLPGVQVTFQEEAAEGVRESTFYYPTGIAGYLQEQNQGCSACNIYTAELEAEGQERYNKPRYTAKIRVGLCFTKEPGFIECYHNQHKLTYGGTHIDKLISEICRQLEWTIGFTADKGDLLAHLRLVVVTDSEITMWVNGTRQSIENILIRDMSQDTVGERFRVYAGKNRDFLSALFRK